VSPGRGRNQINKYIYIYMSMFEKYILNVIYGVEVRG